MCEKVFITCTPYQIQGNQLEENEVDGEWR